MKITMESATRLKDYHESRLDNSRSIESRFRAMGTEVMISIITDDIALAQQEITRIERAISNFERRFSRFLPQSELSLLNSHEGNEFHASKEMMEMLAKAKQWYKKTNGIFDPTVISALETIGYGKNIDFTGGPVIESATVDIVYHQKQFGGRAPFSKLEIDDKKGIVRMPRGLRIDLGGIGKGYIIDELARHTAGLFQNFYISAGGDVFLSGNNFKSEWEIGVQDPLNFEEDIGCVKMKDGSPIALATSGIIKRRGKAGDFEWHHLINPVTGLSVKNNILTVTALAPTATEADVLAKTILILGQEKGIEYIQNYPQAGCVIVDSKKNIVISEYMKKYFIKL